MRQGSASRSADELAAEPGPRPLVSVIMATFNRSNVLRYAIETVLWQTLTDWELHVIGDACTDDTEAVVRSFDDPRIHFVNLAENVGDQSGPNNEGFRLARGRYLACLNHDDLWLPDHLEKGVACLEESDADLVWPLVVARRTDGIYTVHDLNTEKRYEPHLSVPASFWIFRRELVDDVGPWRHHGECHATPSQDWLFRAYCLGKSLRHVPRLTAIALPSGGRPGAYARRESSEHRAEFEEMRESGFREKVLIAIAEHYATLQANPPVGEEVRRTFRELVRRRLAPWWGWPRAESYVSPLRVALRKKARRRLGQLRLHPEAIELLARYGRPGGFIRFLRRFRGLPAQPHTTPLRNAKSSKGGGES